jgi:hypothetical protein
MNLLRLHAFGACFVRHLTVGAALLCDVADLLFWMLYFLKPSFFLGLLYRVLSLGGASHQDNSHSQHLHYEPHASNATTTRNVLETHALLPSRKE